MATTSPINRPITPSNTHGVDTEIVTAIRADIEPNTAPWQFDLRPWHYWVSFSCSAVIFASFLLLLWVRSR